jgi:uncharacterized membrane protein YcaP (DUF421 family)
MLILRVFILTLVSLGVMFILAKLMGNKQIDQLSTFDYINGITIGSIAAELATSEFKDFVKPLVAMIIYGLVAVIISYVTMTTMPLRRFFSGKTLVLYENGKFYKKNLFRCKLDVGELLSLMRINGYFTMKDVESVYLESNGQLSVLPKSDKKPMTPYDVGMKPTKSKAEITLIMDGNILYKNLKASGKNEEWLNKKLKENGVGADEVFLAQTDGESDLSVYINNKKSNTNDIFQ